LEDSLAAEVLSTGEAIARLQRLTRGHRGWITAAVLRLNPSYDRFRDDAAFVALQAEADADPRLSPTAAVTGPKPADSPASPDPKSVVVLPFANLSGDPAQEYFSDGLTEEILTALSNERDLHVPGRTSAFSFKGKTLTAPEIARALNVAQVVEGSVQKSGDQVRIRVTLTRASDGFSEPLGTFTEKLEDIFALQEKVARAVVEKITRRTMTATTVAVQTRNPAAYDAYLRGRAAQMANGMKDEAVRFFQEAIRLDPNYALPWARLSQVYERLISGGFDRGDENRARAREAAAQALRLGPDLPEAHFAVAMIKLGSDWQADAAQLELDDAVRLRPNDPEAPWIQARIDYALGRWDKNLGDLIVRAANLDRQNAPALVSMTALLTTIGRFADADEWCARAAALSPDVALASRNRAVNRAIWTGDLAGALQFVAAVTESMPGAELTLMARGDLRAGRDDIDGAIADYAASKNVAASLGDHSGPRAWIVWDNCKIARLEIRRGNRARAEEILRTAQLDAQKLVKEFPQAPEASRFLALVCALRGEKEESRAALAEAKKATEQVFFAAKRIERLFEAETLALLGETDAAIANLRLLHEWGFAFGYRLRTDPEWAPLRADAKFQQLMKEAEARADAVPRPNK
jgi:TolB-like protein